ncbi:KRAB-A domain-containing protein 2-like [Oopsacas minuta]|uniref:KRAB-A domain-containing protein 2-like n=1 Tax=Oopsacas minuta TaxID=111878 RepID=A0AAV7JMP6_9METZ|nr:KRAB-A domain-containing protein 2-like [Oopsacas minuta]
MVHVKPRHPESHVSVERLNCDVKDILTIWLGDNDSTDWPTGLRFVQFQKDSGYHSGIEQSPFKVLFGRDAQVGLSSASLSSEILERLVSEDNPMAAYQQPDPSQVSFGNQTAISSNLPSQEDQSPNPSEDTSSTSSSAPSSQVTAIQIRHDNIQLKRKRAAEGGCCISSNSVCYRWLDSVLVVDTFPMCHA